MAAVKYISTTFEKLDTISIVKGQLIFVQDKGGLYWDYSGTDRVKLTDIVVFPNDASKPVNPISKFYYFEDKKSLYYYNAGGWNLIGSDIEKRLTDLEYAVTWHPFE